MLQHQRALLKAKATAKPWLIIQLILNPAIAACLSFLILFVSFARAVGCPSKFTHITIPRAIFFLLHMTSLL